MLELAELVDDETQKAMENIDDKLDELQSLVIATLIANSKEQTVEVIDENGNTKKEQRTVVKNRQPIDSEMYKEEVKMSDDVYESVMNSIKTVLAITTSYIVSELGLQNKYKLNADNIFGKGVVIGDRTLNQRTSIVISNLFREIEKIYRKGIIAGQDIGSLSKEIESVIKKNRYQFENIVRSELFMAYRIQFGQSVEMNGVEWIRFHESFPRHPNRKQHKCYELANDDKYGKGKGVFKPTDSIIFFPHPQCTGWLEILE